MDIEKLAYDFLGYNQPEEETPKRTTIKRTRKALQNSYDNVKNKYAYEKGIVESILQEASILEKQYQAHEAKKQAYLNRMKELRELINKIDDEGANHIELDRNIQVDEE
jgi:hypothetical protein